MTRCPNEYPFAHGQVHCTASAPLGLFLPLSAPSQHAGSQPVDLCIQPGSMQGRIKRKQQQQAMEERAVRASHATGESTCALCRRPLGARVEWHHPVPRSQGGEQTVPVHPICHRAIHAHVTNHDLAARYADLDTLRNREDMQRFLRWIASKPANFNAPTRRSRERDEDVAQ